MGKHVVALLIVAALTAVARAEDPIRVVGATRVPADGLPRVAGVKTIEVVHAAPPWTYNHHVDLAAWKGRLYLAWDQCEKDEDVWPSREMLVSSEDGEHWSTPCELFPMGTSTALRMYFFHAPNGRMLAIAGLRTSTDTTKEAKKAGAVVREIRRDHSLGDVFTLRRPNDASGARIPPLYSTGGDPGFVEACDALLKNKPFLEQQDYGRLLAERRMKWHHLANWPADERSRDDFDRFGKAMCFFHRADGALVGVMKWGWVIVSRDEGEAWSPPTRPPSLITGMAKVWGQRTGGGKYVLFYNPDRMKRWPLVMVSGEDGITFGDMRIVNDQHPPLRYAGLNKSEGAQYVRGISEWSSDGTWNDEDAVWIAYSVGKEDVCVSRVPVP